MRLMPPFEGLDETALHDLLVMMMANMEDVLIDCGAIPDEDYNYLDLLRLAQPFVLKRFEDGELRYTKARK